MNPKVSICIPTYNRREYLKETLESVFAQTYRDYEVVVVDDGSTDGTEEMIKSSGYKVRYYWQANRGEPAARNRLIELAQGRFVTFLDSDDLLMPDAIERMVAAAKAQPDDVVVYGPYLRIDSEGNIRGQSKRKLHSGCVTKQLFEDIFVHTCGTLLPRHLIERVGGFDESLPVCADYDLWLRLSLICRFIGLSEPTFKRRRHGFNLSKPSSKSKMIEIAVLERFYAEKGGKDVIPEKIAHRRFSREQYRAGKCLLEEEKFEEAISYFRASFNRHPNLKALLMRGISSLKQKLNCVLF